MKHSVVPRSVRRDRASSAAHADRDLPALSELQDRMEPLDRTEDLDLLVNPAKMLQMTTSSHLCTISASNAQLDPQDPLESPDQRDHLETPEKADLRDHQDDPALRESRDPRDQLAKRDKMDLPETQDSQEQPEQSLDPQDPQESQEPQELRDLQERTADPEMLVALDPKDLKEMLETMEPQETQDNPESQDPTETMEPRDLATTAHHHVLLQDIKHHNFHSVRSSPIVYSALLSRRQRSCYYHFNSHNSNIVTIIRNSSAWPLSEISDLLSSFSSFHLILLYLFPYHSSIGSLT